jgi:hypothetical protein
MVIVSFLTGDVLPALSTQSIWNKLEPLAGIVTLMDVWFVQSNVPRPG